MWCEKLSTKYCIHHFTRLIVLARNISRIPLFAVTLKFIEFGGPDARWTGPKISLIPQTSRWRRHGGPLIFRLLFWLKSLGWLVACRGEAFVHLISMGKCPFLLHYICFGVGILDRNSRLEKKEKKKKHFTFYDRIWIFSVMYYNFLEKISVFIQSKFHVSLQFQLVRV